MDKEYQRKARLTQAFVRLQKLNEQRHLYSIRTAFIATMPLMIIGAYAVVLNQLPIAAYQSFMTGLFGDSWKAFGGLAFSATTRMVTLMVVFSICYNLALWYNEKRHTQLHGCIVGMVGLASYVAVSLPVPVPDALPIGMTGVNGLFVGMIVSVVSAEAFIWLSSLRRSPGLLGDDPNTAVPQAFRAVGPAIVVVFGFAALRMVLVGVFHLNDGLYDITNNILSRPYQNSVSSVGTAFLYNVSSHVMWLFGIHGNNVLDGVAQNMFSNAMQDNMQAAAAGLPIPHILTKTLFDAFIYMGGSGTTLALLLSMMMFGKNKNHRTLLRFSLPNAIFNINEPLVFGIPIVLNPIYAIPFVLTPLAMFCTTYLSMMLGIVPYTTVEVSWATPIFISGYVSTGSFAGVVLQAFNLALGVAIYTPFVRLAGELSRIRFGRAYKELERVGTSEYTTYTRRLIGRVDEVGAVARNLANQMESAMADGQMFLYYQPIVDADGCEMHSLEALLRWKHPEHGFVNPMLIISLAEESNQIDRLGLWVMEQAVRQRREWTDQGLRDFHVSVNVSGQQLNVSDFHQRVADILNKYDVPPQQLQVEITETVALLENEATKQNLRRLHDMGATIAMDDFGVGHSSLLYLRAMPIDTLKIDGSLSREVVHHPANLDIIGTIYDLCQLMDVHTIVEYVDNAQQMKKLKSVGPFLIQGYLFSPPLPSNEVPAFMERINRDCKKVMSTISQ